jgi:hypothetical protein
MSVLRRRVVLSVAVLLGLCCCAAADRALVRAAAAPGAAPPRELPPISAGPCTVSWTPANGLLLRWDGVPVVRKSTLYVVKAGWSGLLLDQRTAPVRVTPWSEDAATGPKWAGSRSKTTMRFATYTFTLAGDGRTFAVDLAYRLKRDVPAEIEYGAAYLSGPVLQGATYTAAGHTENAWEGISGPISVLPPPAGRTQEQNRLAPPFEGLSLATRLGPISVRYEGNARRPVIFDARSDPQGWAQEFPVFWMGIGSPPAPVAFADGERRATFTFAFEAPATATATHNAKAEQPGPDAAQPSLVPVSDARAPYVPPVPLVIPRPKQMIVRGEPFRLTPQTRIVVPDGATQADKQPPRFCARTFASASGWICPWFGRAASCKAKT